MKIRLEELGKNLMKGGEIMRKALLLTLVLSLVLGITSMAWATQWNITASKAVWKWVEDQGWVLVPQTPEAEARAWAQGPVLENTGTYGCNKEKWGPLNVAVHASVAQWIKYRLSASGWQIRVRKPGIYITNCLEAFIDSNADVIVTFEGFDDLKKLEPPMQGMAIETWYAFSDGESPPNNGWVKAKDLNDIILRVPYCRTQKHVWIKIFVRDTDNATPDYPKTRACEYQNDAKIYLQVTVLKNWIDPQTGLFLGAQPSQAASLYSNDSTEP